MCWTAAGSLSMGAFCLADEPPTSISTHIAAPPETSADTMLLTVGWGGRELIGAGALFRMM